MHAEILKGVRPRRFAVAILPEAGTADMLTGVLTFFYYALFTKRAYQIQSYGLLPDFSMAFDSPFINWKSSYPDFLFEHMKFTYKRNRGYDGKRDPIFKRNVKSFTYWYLINNCTGADIFGRDDFRGIGPLNNSAPYAILAANRGRTYAIGSSATYGPAVRQLGMRPQSLARCAFLFLFTPNAGTQRKMEPFLHSVADPMALRIAIQIRVGDDVFTLDDYHVQNFSHFFSCAAEIEKHRRRPWHTRVIWYLTSDSLSVRREAKQLYGEKLLTNTRSQALHTECASYNKSVCSRGVLKEAFQSAVADIYLMTKAQYHVVSCGSGFGNYGAWLSGEVSHPHTYITCEGIWAIKIVLPKNCAPQDALPFEAVSKFGAGR